MKVAIAGGGEVAYQIARELDERLDILVIEDEPDAVARFDRLDVQVVRGSATSIETILGLEIDEEDQFIACGESDERNIISCLAAKQACGVRTTCFLTEEDYYISFAHGERSVLNIDRLISPPLLLAEEIARIVLVPRAIDVHTFLGGRIWVQEYRITASSRIAGRTIMGLHLPGGVLAVAVVRDDELIVPSGDTRIEMDDKVTFMGTQRALRELERSYFKDVVEKVRFVTIVGGGNVGLATARRLEEEGDLELKLIESDEARCEYLASELAGTLVLQGDGTDLEMLEMEQIYRSDVLVSVTSNDETNLLCSLLGRESEIPKIITRVDKPTNLYLFESVGIDVPLNPRATAIKTVLNSLQDTRLPLLGTFEQGRGNVVEFVVPEEFRPRKVSELTGTDRLVIGAVVRNYTTFVPGGKHEIRPGDRLVIFHASDAPDIAEVFR